MKSKVLLPILALTLFIHCQKEQLDPPPVNPVTPPPVPPQIILVPVLLEPANGADNHFRNVTYRWAEIPGAEKYQIHVSREESFSPLIDSDVVSTAHYVSRILLSENAAYYFRVRAQVSGQWGTWSDTSKFTVGSRFNLPDDFRKRYEGTYILRDSVYGFECKVLNPPTEPGPWCAEYGYFSYLDKNDTLVVRFDDDNSLRLSGPNLQDTSGSIYLNYQNGAIHSDGSFSGSFFWTCSSRSIRGYFRNDSLVYTFSAGAGECQPTYTAHSFKGKRL